MTTTLASFETQHEDMIHDVQMDYYGKRLATCSTDKTIKIFEVLQTDSSDAADTSAIVSGSGDKNKNKVKLIATLSGHEAPVWQIQWAHPKFGSILASCSYDRNVIIWKEQDAPATGSLSTNGVKTPSSTWVKIYQHSVHDLSVNSIAWANHEYGLCLACASSDGTVSILKYNGSGFAAQSLGTDNSPGWSVDRFVAHQLGVNSVSWAPMSISQASSLVASSAPAASSNEQQSMRLVTGGCDNVAHIWSLPLADSSPSSPKPTWLCEATLQGHKDWIRDVAWAPSIGLLTSTIATASQDGTVRIWTRESPTKNWESFVIEIGTEPVWRVSWSLSGNILAVTSGDSKVSLWKQSLDKSTWHSISSLDSS